PQEQKEKAKTHQEHRRPLALQVDNLDPRDHEPQRAEPGPLQEHEVEITAGRPKKQPIERRGASGDKSAKIAKTTSRAPKTARSTAESIARITKRRPKPA